MNTSGLQEDILNKLSQVIDPETGADVVRMRLIQDLSINDAGEVNYTFRPSSPLCPLAVPLALSIIEAIANVKGVGRQKVHVVDYVQADQLNEMLKNYLEGYFPNRSDAKNE